MAAWIDHLRGLALQTVGSGVRRGGGGGRSRIVHFQTGGGEVAFHVLADDLAWGDRWRGDTIGVAIHHTNDELRGLAPEGIVQADARAGGDILAGREGA